MFHGKCQQNMSRLTPCARLQIALMAEALVAQAFCMFMISTSSRLQSILSIISRQAVL